jgi:hypothetical protein
MGLEVREMEKECVFLLYAYSFIRNMDEERQKAFMKALLREYHDVEGDWCTYGAFFEGIKGELQELAHQHGRYLEDLEDHPEAEADQ